MREFIVGKNDSNQRLDKFIMKLCPSIPSAMLYKSLRKDCVKINNKHIKDASFKLTEGDIIKLFLKDEFFETKREDFSFVDKTPRGRTTMVGLVNKEKFKALILKMQEHHFNFIENYKN